MLATKTGETRHMTRTTRQLLLPAIAAALLSGCVTYGYRDGHGDYYYGQPTSEYAYPDGYYGDYGYPGYRGEITPDAVTLPQVLQQHGYATFAAGKWHLTNGEHRSRVGPFDSWPTQKGFDRYWGFLEGETDQFEPAFIASGNEIVDVPHSPDYYFPDDLTGHAIQMIRHALRYLQRRFAGAVKVRIEQTRMHFVPGVKRNPAAIDVIRRRAHIAAL